MPPQKKSHIHNNENKYPNFDIEQKYFADGLYVAGVDEAGRGALAGPVVAASVIFSPHFINLSGINDSKLLSHEKRSELFSIIMENAIAVATASEDNVCIDSINILQATQKAMRESINNLKHKPDFLLIDGNYFQDYAIPFRTIIGGDAISLSIAAASIIAKVSRDRWMIDTADKLYPEYAFAKHKGYGTKTHMDALKLNGACPLHRKSFLKKFFANQSKLF